MQKILLLLLLPICAFAANLGTKSEPLEIETVKDLVWIRDAINSGTGSFKGVDISNGAPNIYFKLMHDLDLSTVCSKELGSWEPIGSKDHPFRGSFDGNKKTIDYLYLSRSGTDPKRQFYGLFGLVESGEVTVGMPYYVYIQNLTLGKNSYIYIEDMGQIGGIVGQANNNVQIDSCVNKANIYGEGNVGGIVGYMENSHGPQGVRINNCVNQGKISASAANAAGIVAKANGYTVQVENCRNEGFISSNNYSAGIAGSLTAQQSFAPGYVKNNINTGNTSSSKIAAGIVGSSSNIRHISNFNSGNVSASNAAAGISGTSIEPTYLADNSNNVNAGDIFAGTTAGGIFGTISPDGSTTADPINENLNLGKVSGMQNAGGIVGLAQQGSYSIINNMNAGFIEGEYEGGIVARFKNISKDKIDIRSNLNVGTSDSVETDDTKGSIVGFLNDISSISNQSISIGDVQMNPRCTLYGSDICKATTKDYYTNSLIVKELPVELDEEKWIAAEGFYPQIKSLRENDLPEIRKASALASYPVLLYSADNVWDFKNAAIATSTTINEKRISVKSTSGSIEIADKSYSVVPYNIGFDTILVSIDVATKKIPVYVNVTGALGSAENPLTINSVSELLAFRTAIKDSSAYKGVVLKKYGEGMYFKVTRDLDLSSICGPEKGSWKPISPFAGSFNGGNHVISNLYIDEDLSTNDVGLFGNITGSKIQSVYTPSYENIHLKNVKIHKVGWGVCAGALISRIVSGYVTIRNNTIEANIHLESTSSSANAGGILGLNLGNVVISDNETSGSIWTQNGGINIGGIVANAVQPASIIDNINRMNITADSTNVPYVGGIAASLRSGGDIVGNENYGSIAADSSFGSASYGGIIGIIPSYYAFNIEDNKNYGDIKFNGEQSYIGGIIGMMYSTETSFVSNLENHGDITVTELGTRNTITQGGIGGVIGFTARNNIKNLKNTGTITAHNVSQSYVGGVIGQSRSTTGTTISDLQNDGELRFKNSLSSAQAHIGGVIGFAEAVDELTISNIVNNGNISTDEENPTNADLFVGGVIGRANAEDAINIDNLINNGFIDIQIFSSGLIGGIAGCISLTTTNDGLAQTTNSYNKGSINIHRFDAIENSLRVGGLIAEMFGPQQMSSSGNFGNITINGEVSTVENAYNLYVGGVVGENFYSTKYSAETSFRNVFNSGNIFAKIKNNVDDSELEHITNTAAGIVASLYNAPSGSAENIANYGSINVDTKGDNLVGGLFGHLISDADFEIKNALVTGAMKANIENESKVGAFAGLASRISVSKSMVYASNGIPEFALNAVGYGLNEPTTFTIALQDVVFDQQMTAMENEDYISLYATTELTKLNLVDLLEAESWLKVDNLYPQLKAFAESEDNVISEISAVAATPIYLANNADTTEYTNKVGINFNVETDTPYELRWETDVEGFSVTESKASLDGINKNSFAILQATSENASKQFFLQLMADESKSTLDFSNVEWNYTSPFDYDGEEKTVSITGLPEGVTATYEQNSGTRPGTYEAEVIFNYDESLFTKPAFGTKQTWEIKKKVISLSDVKWDYAGMFDYDSTIKKVSLKNVPEEVYVDYLNNAQLDSGKYVAKAMIHYNEDLYDIEGETYYELTWLISYDTTTTETPETEESSSSGAVSSSSSEATSSSSSETTNSSSSNTENIGVRTTPVIAVRLIRNGADSYILNFDRTDASDIQIQVFDMMGHQIPVEINRQGNKAEIVGIPKNRTSLVRVHSGSISKTLHIQ